MSRSDRGVLILLLVIGCGDDSDLATDMDGMSSAGDTTFSSESTTSTTGDATSTTGDATSSEGEESSEEEGSSSSEGGTVELDCPGIFECVTVCPDEDDACTERCIDNGSEAAIALVGDVLVCAESNGCENESCLAEHCGPELLACAGEAGCDGTGIPELTGPIGGLEASYAAGDPVEIVVAVDEDTARVIVGLYEVGSMLYLGGTAQDVAPSSTVTLDVFAGVVDGATGEFYVAVELCSTSLCTPPMIRSTYQRADRTSPLGDEETYVRTREFVGEAGMEETCPTLIPIQTFLIE